MKSFLPKDKAYLLLVPTVLYHCVPFFQSYITGYMPFFFFVLWLVVEKLSAPVVFRDRRMQKLFLVSMTWYFIYQFVPSIYWLFGHGDFRVPMAQPLNNVALFVAVYMAIRRARLQEIRFLLFVALFGLLLAGTFAFRASGMDDIQGARDMVGMNNAGGIELEMSARDAMSLGLGNYGFMYVCAFLIPALGVGCLLVKNWPVRALIGVVALSLVYCIMTGGLGTPVFVCCFGFVCAAIWFFTRSNFALKILPLLGLFVMALYIVRPTAYSFLSSLFSTISNSMEASEIQRRFKTLSDAFMGDKGSYAYTRYDLQRGSFTTFCENPFFGVGAFNYASTGRIVARSRVGGHSFLLDMLGWRGLFGSAPFYLFIIWMFKYYRRLSATMLGDKWMAMCYVYVAAYLFAGIANPIPLFPATFYLVLPGIAVFMNAESAGIGKVANRAPRQPAVGRRLSGRQLPWRGGTDRGVMG